MEHLPPDFAETLARVVEPGQRANLADVIQAATRLDDEGLRIFLEKFTARVRSDARFKKKFSTRSASTSSKAKSAKAKPSTSMPKTARSSFARSYDVY